MKLDPSRFEDWFRALNDNREPFPWQRRLFREWLCPSEPERARWPSLVHLPTASGKTALIDLAILALAAGSPCARRRVAFVVDRRLVVDEAALRAQAITERLRHALGTADDLLNDVARALVSLGGEEPIVVAVLRGGIPGDDNWARSPAQPAVVLSTVDQVGSRLLFRAYGGHGPRSWPIHAGLLGSDTLIIIDEAHCALAFCQTAQAIADRWQDFAEQPVGRKLGLVRMSATPGEKAEFTIEPEDRSHPILARRLGASKPAELLLVEANREDHRERLVVEIVGRAHRLLESMTSGVVGIVVNRVADARRIFDDLSIPDDRKLLLTGRVRGWDRDGLLRQWLPRLRAGSREPTEVPVAVVATQCIEVGANVDFDALVTEIASLDALRQRFGRLNRLGDRNSAAAVIVATSRQIELTEAGHAQASDPVYGNGLARTWAWLSERARGDPRCLDLGVDALESALPDGDELAKLCQDTRPAYPLLPAHLDLLSQTSPPPEPDPEISAFLHGTTATSPDVTVVWRADLSEEDPSAWPDRVAVQPPLTGEGCPVPIWAFRRWLANGDRRSGAEDAGDIESVDLGGDVAEDGLRVLRWRGLNDAEVLAPAAVMPGNTVVVPSTYGGCDVFGWDPANPDPVSDIGDAVGRTAGRRPVLRLEALARTLSATDCASEAHAALQDLRRWVADDDEAPDPSAALHRLAEMSDLPEWFRGLARSLAGDRYRRRVEAHGAYAIVGSRGSGEDLSTADDRSSLSVTVTLSDHSAGVREYAERFGRAVGLPDLLVSDLALAGWLHDVGKADPRFQVWLHGGNEVAAALATAPLAKSERNPRYSAEIRRARERAGYPEGGRHEVQSLAMIADQALIRAKANDWELVQHLVVSHHGFGRPFVPVVVDADPVPVTLEHGGVRLHRGSDHGLQQLGSGIPDRYWRLVRRYGWWGLSWLEAILRLADHRRSEYEQRQGVNDA